MGLSESGTAEEVFFERRDIPSIAFFAKVVELILARKVAELPPVFREFSLYQRQLVLDAMAENPMPALD